MCERYVQGKFEGVIRNSEVDAMTLERTVPSAFVLSIEKRTWHFVVFPSYHWLCDIIYQPTKLLYCRLREANGIFLSNTKYVRSRLII